MNNFVLLWDGKNRKKSLLFKNPIKIISAYNFDDIKTCFDEIEENLSMGYYVAGYISYEAATAFEDVLPKIKPQSIPLLWFGVYKNRDRYNYWGQVQFFRRKIIPGHVYLSPFNIKPTKSERAYLHDIAKIKNYIRKGDTYQVNYTYKYNFSFKGNAYDMFFDLNRKQAVSYAALIGFDSKKILSISPELFLLRKNNILTMKPMKGTIERGKDIFEDCQKEKELKTSAKNKAENLMIVDMIRNDLGRISEIGSVKTVKLFEIEKYNTLFQMTSTIKSKLKPNVSWYDIFKAIFPSASVTGAPKIRTMQIINELEKTPRSIYTGSIGYISPQKCAVFNVAIRTVLLDENKKQGELGVGGGITISSDAHSELEECKLKAQFFTKKYADFELIETMLWQNNKYFLLNLHLKRLRDSSEYFNFKYSKDFIVKSLIHHSKNFNKNKKHRVRLLLNKAGHVKITPSPIESPGQHAEKIAFSRKMVNSNDTFLYHKTTNRKLYDDEYKIYSKKGFADVIFLNEKNQVTEGAISNIIIKKNNLYYTPPVSCGLLNGVYRQYILKSQKIPLKEKTLYKRDILEAEKIFICNSIRGIMPVTL